MRWLAGWVCVAAVGTATVARADDRAPYRVEFTAPSDCPSERIFVGRVEARTSRVRLAPDDESALTFVVAVEAAGNDLEGSLTIREPGEAPRTRNVRSAACLDVIDALALMVALTLDPDATTEALPRTVEPPPAEPGSTEPEPTEPEPSPPAPRRAAPPAPSPPRPAPREASAARKSWHLGVGARFGLHGAVAPGPTPAVTIFGSVARDPTGAWAPALRLKLHVARSGGFDRSVGTARFEWYAGELELCPLTLPSESTVRLSGCAGLQAGAHRGIGETENPERPIELWLASVGGVRLAWWPAPSVAVELDGAAAVAIARTRFFFEPSSTVHRTPRLSALGGLGVLVVLP